MKKRIKQMVFCSVVVCGVLLNVGCQKCYNCFYYTGWCTCVKGVDSTGFGANSKQAMVDSQDYYNSLGFTCFGCDYRFEEGSQSLCGHQEYSQHIAAGDSCVQAPD